MNDRSNALTVRRSAMPARLDTAGPASGAPSSGIAISKAKAVMLDTPGNADQDGEAIGPRPRLLRQCWRIAASTVASFRSICSRR